MVVANKAIGNSTATTAVQTYWPANGGFLLSPANETLGVGYQFSRYGGYINESGVFNDFGNYVAPVDVPFAMRSLPAGTNTTRPLTTYEVVKPIPDVLSGPAAPAFGDFGMGTQHKLPMTIQDYIDQGYVRIINQKFPTGQ